MNLLKRNDQTTPAEHMPPPEAILLDVYQAALELRAGFFITLQRNENRPKEL
jgi:hypothetical protein